MSDIVPPPNAPRRPPSDDLFTPGQRAALLANGHHSAAGADIDPHPVVKVVLPDTANATWLLTQIDPHEPDRAFGLCDLGLGSPELGYVSLTELRALRGPLGLPVEADQGFVADRSLSNYVAISRHNGRIDV